MSGKRGMVYLVGAGPGDPGLLTVRGRDLLRQADTVGHDRLLVREMLAEVRADAEVIDVGKGPGCHTAPQDEINALLIDRGRHGRLVVRLKGGDPFVFGRGYEELAACRDAGVDCVVVPGVTSAVAGPAAAGIPVTDRRFVRSLAIITARTSRNSQATVLDFKALACIDTVVVLMGRSKLRDVTEGLIDAGRDPSTPAACIEWATTPKQRVTTGTLGSLADRADCDGLRAPVVTVIGEVAAYAVESELASFAVAGARD